MGLRVDRGRIISANYGAVGFLWRNWEIFDQLLGAKFSAARTGNGHAWTGRRYGIVSSCELISSEERRGEGVFHYIISASAFRTGITCSTKATLTYTAVKSNQTAVHGLIEPELRGLLRLVMECTYRKVQKIADEIIEGGEVASVLLCNDFKRALDLVAEESRARLQDAQEAGQFNAPIPQEDMNGYFPVSMDEHPMNYFRSRIEAIEQKYGVSLASLHRNCEICQKDPRLGLAGNRTEVETIVRDIIIRAGLRPGKLFLSKQIDLISTSVHHVPDQILHSMRVVSMFGSLLHASNEVKAPSVVTIKDFEVSLTSTLMVMDWYFRETLSLTGMSSRVGGG